jgi:Lrp/AsnC family leucine-responsive transcriptional regulator
MPSNRNIQLDEIDWRLLAALQENARASRTQLGAAVHLSGPAVGARLRRLEDAGVIRGYRAQLGLAELGLDLAAFVRVRYPTGDHRPFERIIGGRPEVIECHHVTGEDCFVVRVVARSVAHLEETVAALGKVGGGTTTSIVFSTPIAWRPITRELARDPVDDGRNKARRRS